MNKKKRINLGAALGLFVTNVKSLGKRNMIILGVIFGLLAILIVFLALPAPDNGGNVTKTTERTPIQIDVLESSGDSRNTTEGVVSVVLLIVLFFLPIVLRWINWNIISMIFRVIFWIYLIMFSIYGSQPVEWMFGKDTAFEPVVYAVENLLTVALLLAVYLLWRLLHRKKTGSTRSFLTSGAFVLFLVFFLIFGSWPIGYLTGKNQKIEDAEIAKLAAEARVKQDNLSIVYNTETARKNAEAELAKPIPASATKDTVWITKGAQDTTCVVPPGEKWIVRNFSQQFHIIEINGVEIIKGNNPAYPGDVVYLGKRNCLSAKGSTPFEIHIVKTQTRTQ